MISLRPILALAIFATASCDRSEKASHAKVAELDRHEVVIAKFQDGQERFMTLIATVRNEESFDAAAPDLSGVVSSWREVVLTLRELDPPSEDHQAKFRDMISKGNQRTEPTGESMLNLISIESRETEITAWLESFSTTGREAGAEMVRLYGSTK